MIFAEVQKGILEENRAARRASWHPGAFISKLVEYPLSFDDVVTATDWEWYREPKWEPEGGLWTIEHNGNVTEADTVKGYRLFGTERKTKQQAEAARDKMRTFNRLLVYVDEHKKVSEQENCIIFYDRIGERYELSAVTGEMLAPYEIKMSGRVARQLCDDLNSGRFEL